MVKLWPLSQVVIVDQIRHCWGERQLGLGPDGSSGHCWGDLVTLLRREATWTWTRWILTAGPQKSTANHYSTAHTCTTPLPPHYLVFARVSPLSACLSRCLRCLIWLSRCLRCLICLIRCLMCQSRCLRCLTCLSRCRQRHGSVLWQVEHKPITSGTTWCQVSTPEKPGRRCLAAPCWATPGSSGRRRRGRRSSRRRSSPRGVRLNSRGPSTGRQLNLAHLGSLNLLRVSRGWTVPSKKLGWIHFEVNSNTFGPGIKALERTLPFCKHNISEQAKHDKLVESKQTDIDMHCQGVLCIQSAA